MGVRLEVFSYMRCMPLVHASKGQPELHSKFCAQLRDFLKEKETNDKDRHVLLVPLKEEKLIFP